MPFFAQFAQLVHSEITSFMRRSQFLKWFQLPQLLYGLVKGIAYSIFAVEILHTGCNTAVGQYAHTILQATANASPGRGHIHHRLIFNLPGEIIIPNNHGIATSAFPPVVKIFHLLYRFSGLDYMGQNQRAAAMLLVALIYELFQLLYYFRKTILPFDLAIQLFIISIEVHADNINLRIQQSFSQFAI